ncbi:helix-turn-helix domain-containing protein [Lentzea aerocolonigenes]|nr:helix-turn-helix transcriptional regulator [Lentzea aerocolonigenes]
MTPGRDEFGQELRRLCEEAGLTQVQLAARLGYHHTCVSKIESGAREPRIAFASTADDVLQAGGALLAVATKVRARLRANLMSGFPERASDRTTTSPMWTVYWRWTA